MIRLTQSQLLESKTENLERLCNWLGIEVPPPNNRSIGWQRHYMVREIMFIEKKIDRK
jgi:hypothetical protein